MNMQLVYIQECPYCDTGIIGYCDETLTAYCDHCGKKIKICSLCPVTCSKRYKNDPKLCKNCIWENIIDCNKTECSADSKFCEKNNYNFNKIKNV